MLGGSGHPSEQTSARRPGPQGREALIAVPPGRGDFNVSSFSRAQTEDNARRRNGWRQMSFLLKGDST